MCHAGEVARHLLTRPGAARDSLRLVSASGTVGNLKWTRPHYAAQLRGRMGVDFASRPVEAFARGTIVLEDEEGREGLIEATTSWAYVGAGPGIQLDVLGPAYHTALHSPQHRLQVLLSRAPGSPPG